MPGPWRLRRRSKRVVSRDRDSLLDFGDSTFFSDLLSGFLDFDAEASLRSEAEDLIVGGSL